METADLNAALYASPGASSAAPAFAPAAASRGRQTAELLCPKIMVGRVIGKNGETIKALQIFTGALIQIDQSVEPTRVTVSGNTQSLSLALSMISDVCKGTFKGFALLRQMTAQQRTPGAPAGLQARPVYAPGYGLIPPSQLYGADMQPAVPVRPESVQLPAGFQYVSPSSSAAPVILQGTPSMAAPALADQSSMLNTVQQPMAMPQVYSAMSLSSPMQYGNVLQPAFYQPQVPDVQQAPLTGRESQQQQRQRQQQYMFTPIEEARPSLPLQPVSNMYSQSDTAQAGLSLPLPQTMYPGQNISQAGMSLYPSAPDAAGGTSMPLQGVGMGRASLSDQRQLQRPLGVGGRGTRPMYQKADHGSHSTPLPNLGMSADSLQTGGGGGSNSTKLMQAVLAQPCHTGDGSSAQGSEQRQSLSGSTDMWGPKLDSASSQGTNSAPLPRVNAAQSTMMEGLLGTSPPGGGGPVPGQPASAPAASSLGLGAGGGGPGSHVVQVMDAEGQVSYYTHYE